MSTEIPETKVLTEDEELSQILENLPAETEVDVSVPSRGIPYFGKESLLRVRPMTFEDEKSEDDTPDVLRAACVLPLMMI